MAEILELLDLDVLRREGKYAEVAHDPTAAYHFHTGRAHALRLGYPASPRRRRPGRDRAGQPGGHIRGSGR
jgi:hypothetical protein